MLVPGGIQPDLVVVGLLFVAVVAATNGSFTNLKVGVLISSSSSVHVEVSLCKVMKFELCV